MAPKQPVNRDGFSSPLYNEAVIHGGLIYCSGKVGLDLTTGQLVGEHVAEQTKAALELIQLVLRTAGSDITRMLKCNIFLTNMSDFAAMNAAYIATVPDPKPARICVCVSELGRGAKVEIDCIAAVEDNKYFNKAVSRL